MTLRSRFLKWYLSDTHNVTHHGHGYGILTTIRPSGSVKVTTVVIGWHMRFKLWLKHKVGHRDG